MDQSSPPDEAEQSNSLDSPKPFTRDKFRRSFDRATYNKLHRNNTTNSGSKRNVNDLKKLFEKTNDEKLVPHDVNINRPVRKDSNFVNRRQSFEEGRTGEENIESRVFDKKTSRSVETVHRKVSISEEVPNKSGKVVNKKISEDLVFQSVDRNLSDLKKISIPSKEVITERSENKSVVRRREEFLQDSKDVDKNTISERKENSQNTKSEAVKVFEKTISESVVTKNTVPFIEPFDSHSTQSKVSTTQIQTSENNPNKLEIGFHKTSEEEDNVQLRQKPLIQVKPLKNEEIAQRVSNIEKLQSSLRKSLFEDTPILARKIFPDKTSDIDSPIPQRKSVQEENNSRKEATQDFLPNDTKNCKSFEEVDNPVINLKTFKSEELPVNVIIDKVVISKEEEKEVNSSTKEKEYIKSEIKLPVEESSVISQQNLLLHENSKAQTNNQVDNERKLLISENRQARKNQSPEPTEQQENASTEAVPSTSERKPVVQSSESIEVIDEKKLATKEEVLDKSQSIKEDRKKVVSEEVTLRKKQSTKEHKTKSSTDNKNPSLTRKNSKSKKHSTERRVSFSPDIEHFPIPAPRKSLTTKNVQVVTVEVKTVQIDSATPVVLPEEKKDVNSNYKNSEYECAVDEETIEKPVNENLKDTECPVDSSSNLIESEDILRKKRGRRYSEVPNTNSEIADCNNLPATDNSSRLLERPHSAPPEHNSSNSEESTDPFSKSKETNKTYPAGILRKPSITRSVDESWRKAAEEVLKASKNRRSLVETTNESLTNSPTVNRNSKTIYNILSKDNFDKSPSPTENKPNPFHPKPKSWRNSLISKPKIKSKPKLKEVKAKVEPEAEAEIEIRYILPRQASEDSIYKIKSALDLFVMDDKKEKKRTNSFKKIFKSFGKKDKDKDKDKKKPKKIENEIVGDNAQNESFNRNSKEVNVVNKNLPEIPNEEAEKRYAQMHINRYNQVRANFEASEDYVCMDNGAKYTYINTSEVNKYIDTSSSSNTLNSENLAFRDSDNSSGLEKFLETPPRAFDTYQNVQLVKPKANIPINSERPLPLPYQDDTKHDIGEGVYGTVYDRKKSPETSDRSLSSRSPSLEGSKLKLPANRERVELQPRIKSPIPPNEVSTDKIIATELLKGKKKDKEDKLTSPSHQRLEIDIDYPETGMTKGKPPVSPQNKMLQNLEAGEWHKRQREMHLSPSLEAMELQMKQMGRLSPAVEDWQKLKQMRDLDDWKKQRASPNMDDLSKRNSLSDDRQRNSLDDRQNKQRNSLDEWQNRQRNSLEDWQRKHMERVEDWQKKHISNDQNRMSPTIAVDQQNKQRGSFSQSVEDWKRQTESSRSPEKQIDDSQKHRYVPMSAIQLSPIPHEKPRSPLSPSFKQKSPTMEEYYSNNSTVPSQPISPQGSITKLETRKPNYTEADGNNSNILSGVNPELERKMQYENNFQISNKVDENTRPNQNQVMELANSESSRKISSQQEEFQRKFGRTGNSFQAQQNNDGSQRQMNQSNEGASLINLQNSLPQRKISENREVFTANQYQKSESLNSQPLDFQNKDDHSDYRAYHTRGIPSSRNRSPNDSANYQNDYEIYGQRNQVGRDVEYQNRLRQQQINQNRIMEQQMNQSRPMDALDYQKQMHQHNLLEWQRLHSKPPIERKPLQSPPNDQRKLNEGINPEYQKRLQSPPVEQQRQQDQNRRIQSSPNGQFDQERRTLSPPVEALYGQKVVTSEALYGSTQQRLTPASEVIYGQRTAEGVYGSNPQRYGSNQQRRVGNSEGLYGSNQQRAPPSDAVFRSNQQKLNAQSEGMYGTKVPPSEARNPSSDVIYGSKTSSQEGIYGSKTVSSEGVYGTKSSSSEGMYGGKSVSQDSMYGGNQQQVRIPSSDGIYGSKTESLYGSNQQNRVPPSEVGGSQMTTNVMVHVDSHSPQNRCTTPVNVSRSTTPVNLRSPSHLSLLQKTPPKHEIRQSVEAFCWKELKKMKEQEDIQMQIQLSNYGYLEDPIISHRSRSMSPNRARNTRRSTSLPREVQRQRRMEDAGVGPKVREPIYGQRVAYNPNPNFTRNSPQRSTIGTTGVTNNGKRPIFNRGSLTQSFNKDPQGLYYKRVGFHSPQNPENPQAWPTKNGYTQSPPQRRIELKTEVSMEDEVFLPNKIKDAKGNELTREEIFMMNQQRQRQMREMKEPIYSFRPLPNEVYRQNGQREPIYGTRTQNRNEIYGTRQMPNIHEEGVYMQKPNLQRNNSFTQRYDLPPTSEPIYGRNPNEIYGRLGQRPSTVNNKVCDMYGKIHDTPVQQSGVLYGQLHRNTNAPPMQYQSYNQIQQPNQNFIRGTRLTASVNDMNRYYHQPPDRPLPPIPNDKKSRRSNNPEPESSFQKTRIAGK